MTEKWRKDVKSVEKFFVPDRNREDLFFGDNIQKKVIKFSHFGYHCALYNNRNKIVILLSLLRSLRRKVKQYRLLYVQVTADQQLSKKNTLEFLNFFSHWSLLCTLILKTKPKKALNENEEIIIPTLNLEVVYISINHLDVSLTIVNLAHWLAKKKKPSVVTNAKVTSHHLSPGSWGVGKGG